MTRDEFLSALFNEQERYKNDLLTSHSGAEIYNMACLIADRQYLYDYFYNCIYDFTEKQLLDLNYHCRGDVIEALADYYWNGQVLHDLSNYDQDRRFVLAFLADEVYS